MTSVAFVALLSGNEDVVSAAEWQAPRAVAAATDGTIYVADDVGEKRLPGIWKVADGKRTVVVTAEKKFRTPFNAIRCLAVDREGRLLVGDSGTREVYRFEADGKPKPLTSGKIGIPMGIGVDSQGNIIVADLESHRLMKVPADGGEPIKLADVPAPQGLTVDSKDRVWVVSRSQKQLYRVAPDGQVEPLIDAHPFGFPHDVVVDSVGTATITDSYGKALWQVDENGKPSKWIEGSPFVNPVRIALAGKTLYVSDSQANQVFVVDAAGTVTPLEAADESKPTGG